MTTPDKDWLTAKQAAEYLNLAYLTLCRWRSQGTGPRFVRMGTGTRCSIRYSLKDLDAYIEACAVSSKAA